LMQFQLHAPLPAVRAMASHRKNRISVYRPMHMSHHSLRGHRPIPSSTQTPGSAL
jgi:hypothetical protein